jgi:hypothetical protein
MLFFIIILLLNLCNIYSYEYSDNDQKLFENFKNFNKFTIDNNDINYKNINYFIDKKYNCILFYYKYIQDLQNKNNNDIIYFQDYYNYWKPNSFEKVCIHMIKIYNDYIINFNNKTINFNNKLNNINNNINKNNLKQNKIIINNYNQIDEKDETNEKNNHYFKYNHKYLRTNNK